jgi:hypothetical protein
VDRLDVNAEFPWLNGTLVRVKGHLDEDDKEVSVSSIDYA